MRAYEYFAIYCEGSKNGWTEKLITVATVRFLLFILPQHKSLYRGTIGTIHFFSFCCKVGRVNDKAPELWLLLTENLINIFHFYDEACLNDFIDDNQIIMMVKSSGQTMSDTWWSYYISQYPFSVFIYRYPLIIYIKYPIIKYAFGTFESLILKISIAAKAFFLSKFTKFIHI